MNDEPVWADNQLVQHKRKIDHLKRGDVIQQWVHVRDAEYRVTWEWRDGDVLSIVKNPCEGIAWVALVQWHDGDVVKDWTALTQIDWAAKGVMLRRKP